MNGRDLCSWYSTHNPAISFDNLYYRVTAQYKNKTQKKIDAEIRVASGPKNPEVPCTFIVCASAPLLCVQFDGSARALMPD